MGQVVRFEVGDPIARFNAEDRAFFYADDVTWSKKRDRAFKGSNLRAAAADTVAFCFQLDVHRGAQFDAVVEVGRCDLVGQTLAQPREKGIGSVRLAHAALSKLGITWI